jgi:hypothetical protein
LTRLRCCSRGGPPISSYPLALSSGLGEERRGVLRPDEKVDVCVRPRHAPKQKIECPAAAKPAVDTDLVSQRREFPDQLELSLLAGSSHTESLWPRSQQSTPTLVSQRREFADQLELSLLAGSSHIESLWLALGPPGGGLAR